MTTPIDATLSGTKTDGINMEELKSEWQRVASQLQDTIGDCNYINASWITTAKSAGSIGDVPKHSVSRVSFFASQGPLPHTVAHHLQMIQEQRPCAVIMLTKLEEAARNGNTTKFVTLVE
jgi:protein tyrosine phosphatase